MERKYVDPNEGRISEEEEVLWAGKSSLLLSIFLVFIYLTPFFTIIFYWSFIVFEIYGWVIVGLIGFTFLMYCVVELMKNFKCREEYAITNKKIVLHKRRLRLRYWFTYEDFLHASVKRNLADIIFNRGSIKLLVIHTYHRDYEIVERSVGTIYMLHIKNYQLVTDALNELKKKYNTNNE